MDLFVLMDLHFWNEPPASASHLSHMYESSSVRAKPGDLRAGDARGGSSVLSRMLWGLSRMAISRFESRGSLVIWV